MKRIILAALFCILLAPVMSAASDIRGKIAQDYRIISEDEWHGFHRIKFDFEGKTAWVVEPNGDSAPGCPWTWTMQWAEAFVNRTGVPSLLAEGFHHVTLEVFDERASDEGLARMARFQKWLVERLGFAPKARLIGMSWGGFFSIRYAAAYPENVAKIYLDAPLLNFEGFSLGEGSGWQKGDTCWTDDPRMPVNMTSAIAAAGIPVFLIYGGQDQTVNPILNSELFASRFKDAGGNLTVRKRDAYGHHPHGVDVGDPIIINFLK